MVDPFDKLLLELERCLMGTSRRQFTDEFKREAVGLLASSGRPLSQIARELGIAASMLRAWRDAGGPVFRHGSSERECPIAARERTRSFKPIPASEETTNTQRFEADSLADETVSGEPVSGANSLRSGKITGNFTKIGPFGETSPVRTQQNQ